MIKDFKLQTINDIPVEITPIPGINSLQLNYEASIGGANAPEPGADKTSENVAASILNQGTLATKSDISAAEIADRTITSVKLALLTVSADVIAAGAITESKLYTGAVTADKIAANAITAAKIAANTITADKIAASTITAAKMNVSQLSAITANLGSITSGTITGALLQTSSSNNTGVKMSSELGGINVYGQTLSFYSGSSLQGWLYADGAMRLYSASGRNLSLSAGSGTIYMECTVIPSTNSSFNLGSPSYLWGNVFTQNVDFGSDYYISRSGAVAEFNKFTNLSIGGYTFRPVGFTFKDSSGNNKYLIVLATADPA